MSQSHQTAEALYFDVYDYVVAHAEYFQPYREKRLLLPEAIISFAVASILVPLVQGFAKKIGERGAEAVLDALKPAPATPPPPESLIEEIEARLPAMLADAERLTELEADITLALTAQGLSAAKAGLIAQEVTALLRRRLGHDG